MQIEKENIKSMLPEELEEMLRALGMPKYRGGQIFKWLSLGAESYEEMTDIPKDLRSRLSEDFPLYTPGVLQKQISKIDGTAKYLWELNDKNAVETVVMQYKHGNTVCISSQVGCKMGCRFCASTLGGLVRNLTAGEMLDQVIFSGKQFNAPISNIVLMGIGEPLDNFDNVMKFLKLVTHPKGINMGMRHISLSTCGLAERIDKLGDYNLQLTLSVSLHGPDNETRSSIMPVNRQTDVETLIKTCRSYFDKTGRRISFEYAMIENVNDSDVHGKGLARLLTGGKNKGALFAHVNLIPLNPVRERQFNPSPPERVKAFKKVLEEAGINVTVRRRLGRDVDASCGQLRRKSLAINKSCDGVYRAQA